MTRITARTSSWNTSTTLDDRHRSVEIDLPAGTHEDDVEVLMEYLGRDQQPDQKVGFIVLKTAKKKDKANVRYAQPAAPAPAAPDAGQRPVAAPVVETKPLSVPEAGVSETQVEQKVSDATQPATGEQSPSAGNDERGELPASRDTRRTTRRVRNEYGQELGSANDAPTEGLRDVSASATA